MLGLAGAVALDRAMRSLLHGVRPFGSLVPTLVVASLASVATVATLVPARRATRVDPTIALASE